MENDFDSVSWEQDHDSKTANAELDPPDNRFGSSSSGKRKASGSNAVPQAGSMADDVDLAGIGEGTLQCTVDTPLKEHDGTKDAYVSYLITTQVRKPYFDGFPRNSNDVKRLWLTCKLDGLCVFSEASFENTSPFHRLCLPL